LRTITILFLCFVNLCFSQTSSLKISESQEFKDSEKSDEILSIHTSTKNVTGIVREGKKHLLFDIFDASFDKFHSEVIEKSKNETFVGDVYFDDEIKVFTVEKVNKSERNVYAHIFNFLNKSHSKVKLFSATVEKNQPLFSGGNKRQTSLALSPNGNFLAISTDNIKKNLNSYTVRVFDANSLKLVYSKVYQEDSEKFFEPNDMVIDDSGQVYVLGKKYFEGRREKKQGEANYNFVLNEVSKNNLKTLQLGLEGEEHIRSLNISQSNPEAIQLMGFYSENKAGRIKGGCSFLIDVENELTIKNKVNIVLPLSVYEDLYGENRADRKKDKELTNFYIDHVLQDDNGNTYLIAEEFYITQAYVPNGQMGGTTVTTFHYDDILVLKFNANNSLDWGRSIFKKANMPSYNAFLKDNKLHVILNSGKNLTEKSDGRTKVSKGILESSSLYDIVFNTDGEVIYNKVQDNKGNTYYTPFRGTYKNSKFVMMSDPKSKKQFMILE
jgi:hypothetical protein